MSWLFSQALVAEYLADTCSDGEPSAPSSGNPTQRAYCAPDKMTAFSRLSRFGMTFAPLTENLGTELLMWFREVSRARTSAQPARGPESAANDPAFGARWRELSVRFDRDTCSWRTHRSLWDEALHECSLTLPRWGSMRDGVLSERVTLERPTCANDAGLLPTPVAQPANGTPEMFLQRKRNAVAKGSAMGVCLSDLQLVMVAKERGMDGRGKLNPEFAEWMMGWPRNWTALEPLATGKCRNVRRLHGGF